MAVSMGLSEQLKGGIFFFFFFRKMDEEDVPFVDIGRLDPAVEQAISEVFPSEDPLDNADFDAVGYINSIFPNEQSLANLDDFVIKLRTKIKRIDDEVGMNIRAQTRAVHDGGRALADAQAGMDELFAKIRDIRSKAEVSEHMVQEITRDIKSLDYAKRHLTSSITTLNHLHMLVGGVESLHIMSKERQYRDAANLLSAVVNVMEHFQQHMEVERVKDLHRKIEAIQRSLGAQITSEFHAAFKNGTLERGAKVEQLTEGCCVLDVLDPSYKEAVVGWFVQLQLKDYQSVFNPSAEAAWVDKIDRRYAWFKRTLASYMESCAEIFPEEWTVPELIAVRFCELTRSELARLLHDRHADLDVKLLLFALVKTTQFEQWLVSRFRRSIVSSAPEEKAAREPEDTEALEDVDESTLTDADRVRLKYLRHRKATQQAARVEEEKTEPKGPEKKGTIESSQLTISVVFSECMDVYIDAQDRALADMIEQFVRNFKGDLPSENDTDDANKVLPSCADLFLFFKNCMLQCAQLTSQTMFELYKVFKRYLKAYAQRVLTANIPKSSTLSSILYKDTEVRLSTEELFIVCCILNTAEYCLETTRQLQDKLQEKVEADRANDVDLNDEQDLFHEVISNCIQLLVRALETQCEPALTAMTKLRWDAVEEVGDTSPYVSQMGKHVAQVVPLIRTTLSDSRKYFTNFCLKFVQAFIPRIIMHLYKCKNVTSVGAEQLLLDMQSVRMLLLEMPSIGSAVARKPPTSYTRFVTSGMTKSEMILKVLMSPHDPPNLYVQDYLKLIGEEEGLPAFQRILDMKGLKKGEQHALLEAFRVAAPSAAGVSSTPANAAAGAGAAGGSEDGKGKDSKEKGGLAATAKRSSIRKLEKLMKRFQ
eukprot:m.223021 g.223021  ORF g.223021 m.223021 type:complete len:878 (+) comp22314_c4_seq5:1676-4309(+)